MEIVKHGDTYREATCDMCQAVVGYTYRDVEHKVMHDAYHGKVRETISEYFYCPECGCRIVLSLKIDGVPHENSSNQ